MPSSTTTQFPSLLFPTTHSHSCSFINKRRKGQGCKMSGSCQDSRVLLSQLRLPVCVLIWLNVARHTHGT